MLPRITTLLHGLLDLLFPQKASVRELLRMDPFDLASRAEKPEGRAGKALLSCFSYRDPLIRQAIWELKYRGNKKVAVLLATILHDELLAFLEEYAPLTNFTDPLLIPIPLSKKRERERGFNQCHLLVDEIMRLDSSSISPNKGSTAVFGVEGCISPNKGSTRVGEGEGCQSRTVNDPNVGRNFTLSLALTKIKDTPSQTKAENRESRMKNLENCFRVKNPMLVVGRNIILIDDVATTGATLQEARRTLRASGARKVIAFTVAH